MSIPLAKNCDDGDAVGARDRLDVVDEPPEAACRRLADVGVLDRGRVRLQLTLEHGAVVLERLCIRVADRRRAPRRLTCPPQPHETRSSVRAKQASMTAMNSSFFEPKRRKRYGCEMPARRAIASVEAPWSPRSANSTLRRLEDGDAPLVRRLSWVVVAMVE